MRFELAVSLVCLSASPIQSLLVAQADPVEVLRASWSEHNQSVRFELPVVAAGGRHEPRAERAARLDRQIKLMRKYDPQNLQGIARLEESVKQRMPVVLFDDRPPPGSGFRHTFEAKNNSAQQVHGLAWDYVFLEPKTSKEIIRHSFVNEVRIKPGEILRVQIYSVARPQRILQVDAKDLNKEPARDERVEVRRITFADGTVWQR